MRDRKDFGTQWSQWTLARAVQGQMDHQPARPDDQARASTGSPPRQTKRTPKRSVWLCTGRWAFRGDMPWPSGACHCQGSSTELQTERAHLNGPLRQPLRLALALQGSGLPRGPRQAPRGPRRSVEPCTARWACRPGALQFRPSLLSEGYFRPLTYSKPILIFPKLPLYLYKPISNQLNPYSLITHQIKT